MRFQQQLGSTFSFPGSRPGSTTRARPPHVPPLVPPLGTLGAGASLPVASGGDGPSRLPVAERAVRADATPEAHCLLSLTAAWMCSVNSTCQRLPPHLTREKAWSAASSSWGLLEPSSLGRSDLKPTHGCWPFSSSCNMISLCHCAHAMSLSMVYTLCELSSGPFLTLWYVTFVPSDVFILFPLKCCDLHFRSKHEICLVVLCASCGVVMGNVESVSKQPGPETQSRQDA